MSFLFFSGILYNIICGILWENEYETTNKRFCKCLIKGNNVSSVSAIQIKQRQERRKEGLYGI